MARRFGATAVVALCVLAGSGQAWAAAGDPPPVADAASTVQLDGPAEAVVKAGSRLIVGGNFSYAGPYTGSAASLSLADGTRSSSESLFAGGAVHAIVPDGSGGFFVGGEFTTSDGDGGTHAGLAHVDASGVVQPGFAAQILQGQVQALAYDPAVAPNGVVFVGGADLQVDEATAPGALVAVDAASGDPDASFGPDEFDGEVDALAYDATGDRLYVGGNFTQIGSASASHIARIVPSSGALDTTWAPQLVTDTWLPVSAIALDPTDSLLYVGGDFTGVTASGSDTPTTRSEVAAIATADGSIDAFDPEPDGPVEAILPTSGKVYIGGSFATLHPEGGPAEFARTSLARFSVTSGAAASTPDTDFTAQMTGGAPDVLSFGLTSDGSGLLVGGTFRDIKSSTGSVRERHGLALLTTGGAQPGTIQSFNPGTNGGVEAIAAGPSRVEVGGQITSVNGFPRHGLVALFAGSGAIDPAWAPSANDEVDALAVAPDGSAVYAAGYLSQVGNVVTHVAKLDPATGQVDPNMTVDLENTGEGPTYVSSLAVTSSLVYLGGSFTTVGGLPRAHVAAVSTTGHGEPVPGFDPGDVDGAVQSMLLAPATGRLYVGGTFSYVGANDAGHARAGVAALSAASGALQTAFDAQLSSATEQPPLVTSLALSGSGQLGDRLFVGGTFDGAGGQARTALAAVDPQSGAVASFDVPATGTLNDVARPCNLGGPLFPCVGSLALTGDGTLLVAGGFDHLGGMQRTGLASITGAVGAMPAVGDWNPNPAAPTQPIDMVRSIGTRVFVGGKFGGYQVSPSFAGGDHAGFASFGLAAPGSVAAPQVQGLVHAGQTISCDPGTWTGDPASFTYSWRRDGSTPAFDIAGETSQQYAVNLADVGHTLRCAAKATNAAGTSSEAVSAAVTAAAADPPVNTSPPAISGTPKPGNILTCSTGTWGGDQPQTYSYQWLRDSQPLDGFVGSEYSLTANDDGRTITCRVTATQAPAAGGATANATSQPVGIGDPPSGGQPTLSGSSAPAPGDVLSCSAGTWSGSQPITFTFRWLRDGVAIAAATGSTYKVDAADDGRAIACEVTARNAVGAASAKTAAVQARTPRAPASVTAPEVTGTTLPGNTLNCSAGAWTGDFPQQYSYQWLVDNQPIPGATGAAYVVAREDEGHLLTCRVTATNSVAATNAASAPVAIGTAPSNATAPSITGLAQQNQTLTCAPGGWAGSAPQKYAFEWLRQGTAVATGETYPVREDDVGRALVCRVTAANVVGSAAANSAAVTPDLPPPVRGVNANLEPRSGLVLVKTPRAKAFTRVSLPKQIPVGTQVDTTKGRAELTTAVTSRVGGPTQTAQFFDGPFRVAQPRSSAITTLTILGGCRSLRSAAAARETRAPSRTVKRLWAVGKGKFRTRGHFAAASVRGTSWLTEDSCAGTRVKVKQGVVSVRALRTRRTTTLRKGQSIFVAR
jgi:hypothetical protein